MMTTTSMTTIRTSAAHPRIAILTWYSYWNYGTVLQAYAMQTTVKNLKYEPFDIAYNPEIGAASHERKRLTIERLISIFKWVYGYRALSNPDRSATFEEFIQNNIKLTKPVATSEEFQELNSQFDCFICGSDQVWSPRFFDPRYYLDFVEDSTKKIAYAPSFGCDSLEGHPSSKRIGQLLQTFSAIGVREESGKSIVAACTGREPTLVLDPTLLLGPAAWRELSAVSREDGPYCLFYFLGNYKPNRRAAQNIAHKLGLRIVEVPVFQADLKDREAVSYPVGPKEFLTLLDHAELICTDSFHGTAFATLFSKPLVVFERFDPASPSSQNTRIYSFLNMFGMQDNMLGRSELDNWHKLCNHNCNYNKVDSLLEKRRNESISFLNSSIERAIRSSFEVNF